jgi:hypothetical protein
VAAEDIPAMKQLIDHVFGTGDLAPAAEANAERISPVTATGPSSRFLE